MIFLDATNAAGARHRSGLVRAAGRLGDSLGTAAVPVDWRRWDRAVTRSDWFLAAELFSEEERPGIAEFIRGRRCRSAAIFYDAIPLKHPHITWPRSVARHPGYLGLLAAFDRVFAISAASRDELLGFWKWRGVANPPPVDVLQLGADFDGSSRVTGRVTGGESGRPDCAPRGGPSTGDCSNALLCVGIIEPRKNQSFLVDVCAELWDSGLGFDLHIAGRVNPHFGAPIAARIRALRRKYPGLRFHAAPDDTELARLLKGARATVFPTIAEGSGLPLLESLWRGVPVVGSDIPPLRENASGGGCLLIPTGDRDAWVRALRGILTDHALHARLVGEAVSRPLPTWADAARTLLEKLGS
jgi:glycosyltransferase involved in cell wall biosynthesis